jgi:hypothetical protein
MNILVDHHHGALLRSMSYLFKKRFNCRVFVPKGMEWLDETRLYSCYPMRDTADQMLNSWVWDSKYNNEFEPLTLEMFKNIHIDVIVSSLWENHSIFDNIIKTHDKKSKLVLQVGNNIHPNLVYSTNTRNLLSSSWPTYVKSDVKNKVFYHQEFNTDLFSVPLISDVNIKSVANFKNIMEEDFHLFTELERRLPDWTFKAYGALNRDGSIHDSELDISNEIKKFGFIFHVKKDDGYGHIIHNSFACGKPMLIDYKKTSVDWNGELIPITANKLYDNNDTIIDVNNGVDFIVEKLLYMSNNYKRYSNIVYSKFQKIVNFDKEQTDIEKFLKNLV